jgi:hypothetical protein
MLRARGYAVYLEEKGRALPKPGRPGRYSLAGIYVTKREPEDWEEVITANRPLLGKGVVVIDSVGLPLAVYYPNQLPVGRWLLSSNDPDFLAEVAAQFGGQE